MSVERSPSRTRGLEHGVCSLLFAICSMLFAIGCRIPPKPKLMTKTVKIFYLPLFEINNNLSKIGFRVKTAKSESGTLFIAKGLPFKNRRLVNPAAKILKTAEIDAFLLTPKDLECDIESLKTYLTKTDFSLLACNLKDLSSNKPLFHEYLIKKIPSGEEIAIIGILTDSQSLRRIDPSPESGSGDKRIRFENPDYALKRLIPILRLRGIEIFVLLSENPISFEAGTGIDYNLRLGDSSEETVLELVDSRLYNYYSKPITISDSLPKDTILASLISDYQKLCDSLQR